MRLPIAHDFLDKVGAFGMERGLGRVLLQGNLDRPGKGRRAANPEANVNNASFNIVLSVLVDAYLRSCSSAAAGFGNPRQDPNRQGHCQYAQ
jgi:hypothetical protein